MKRKNCCSSKFIRESFDQLHFRRNKTWKRGFRMRSVWAFWQHAVWIKQASIISVSLGDYSLSLSLSLCLKATSITCWIPCRVSSRCIVHIVYSRWVTTIRTSILCVYQPAKKIYFHAWENNFNYFESMSRYIFFKCRKKRLKFVVVFCIFK